jgi:hypothetical protein
MLSQRFLSVPRSAAALAREHDVQRLAVASLELERLFHKFTLLSACEPEIARLGGEPLRFEAPSAELQQQALVVQAFLASSAPSAKDAPQSMSERREQLLRALLRPGSADYVAFITSSQSTDTAPSSASAAGSLVAAAYKRRTEQSLLDLLLVLPSALDACGHLVSEIFFTAQRATSAPHQLLFRREYVLQVLGSVCSIVCDLVPPACERSLLQNSPKPPSDSRSGTNNDNNAASGEAAATTDDDYGAQESPHRLLRRLATAAIVLAEGIESANAISSGGGGFIRSRITSAPRWLGSSAASSSPP